MFFIKKRKIPLHEFFPEGFVDMHSHLLPGIDDGATDLDNSIALIEKLSSFGIRKFITTPHVLEDLYPNTPEIIREKEKLVQNELKKRNLTNISIKAAAEYMLDEKFNEILEKEAFLTLKDNLVLIEMSYLHPPAKLFEMLFEMQLKGYKPVLAHPERYISYHHNQKVYSKLKNAGCLFQLNLFSLTNQYNKSVQIVSEKLLKENMYDFLGTDTHNLTQLELFTKLSTKNNYKKLEQLISNNTKYLV